MNIQIYVNAEALIQPFIKTSYLISTGTSPIYGFSEKSKEVYLQVKQSTTAG